MTKKRFIKLMMAQGYSRNKAVENYKFIRRHHIPNAYACGAFIYLNIQQLVALGKYR